VYAFGEFDNTLPRDGILGGDGMPQTSHVERYCTSSETIRGIVIGMSDGLTVPFALAAGRSE
jgi:hypothetical protein